MDEQNPFSEIKTYDRYRQPAYLFLFVTLASVAVSLAATFVFNKLLKLGLASTEITSFAQGAVYTLACLKALKDLGADPGEAWRDWRAGLRGDAAAALKYYGFYLLIIGAMLALAAGVTRFTSIHSSDLVRDFSARSALYDSARAVMETSGLRFSFLLFSFCVLAPIGEELLFRRIIYTTLRKKLSFFRALFASSVIFAAVHGSAALVVFPVSLLLGYVYEKKRRLPVNIMLHALINLFALAVRLT